MGGGDVSSPLPVPRSPLPAWLSATRPKTLAAGAVPVAVGTALAAGVAPVRWEAAVGCLAGALLIQIGCNFANDALDALRGADGPDRLGPRRAVASGLITPRAMLIGTALVLSAAFLLGLWLSWLGGWPILALGVVSITCAVAYTGGPFPLAYRGLGDLFVFLFFGLAAVLGTAWVVASAGGAATLTPWWWAVAAAVGLQATAIIAVNNLRDRATDARAGKRTLAVRLGGTATRIYYLLLHLGAAACLLAAPGLAWAALLAAVGGGALAIGVWRSEGGALNRFLGLSAALELATGIAVCVLLQRG